jgi:hypothetical protein
MMAVAEGTEMKRSFDRTASSFAAVAVLAALLTTACTAGQEAVSATPASTAQVLTTPAPSVAPPSVAASTSPSPTAAPVIWTTASLKEDWPAPVRTEHAGPATIVPFSGRYQDPTSDTESGAFPWTDIHVVGFGHNNAVVVWVPGAPNVDPTEQWIAYGLVVDDDGDGVADRRFGMDNIPGSATDWHQHRAWITDLHTGRTESSVLNSLDYSVSPEGIVKTSMVGNTFFGASLPARQTENEKGPSCFPARHQGPSHPNGNPPPWMRGLAPAQLAFGGGGETAGSSVQKQKPDPKPARFYAWASVIVDGRVMATDYAPDAGWLHPSSKAPSIEDEVVVAPPIDSLEEAVAAVAEVEPGLTGFLASDTKVPGASAWIEAEARGDGWDIAYVCADSPDGGVNHTAAKLHVRRNGTVDEICVWQDPSGNDYAAPGYSPPESEEAGAC